MLITRTAIKIKRMPIGIYSLILLFVEVKDAPTKRRQTTTAKILVSKGLFQKPRMYGFFITMNMASIANIPAITPAAIKPGLRQTIIIDVISL